MTPIRRSESLRLLALRIHYLISFIRPYAVVSSTSSINHRGFWYNNLNFRTITTKMRSGQFQSAVDTVKPAQELAGLGKDKLKSFMENIDAIIFDCDGVLWQGMDPVENAPKLLNHLREAGKRLFFLTNNSTRSRAGLLEKFTALGLPATEEEMLSVAHLTAMYLKQLGFKRKAYVIASTDALTEELASVGIESLPIGPDPVPPTATSLADINLVDCIKLDPEVGAVIVGFDLQFSYLKAIKAASYLNQKNVFGEERLFIGTNPDEQCPARGPGREHLLLPIEGTFVSAIKTCSGKEPIIVGKPAVFPFRVIQKQYGLDPKRVLMIGDRGETDMLFGNKCGLWTLLVVRTGVHNIDDLHKWENSSVKEEQMYVPHYYAKDVNEFYRLISDAN